MKHGIGKKAVMGTVYTLIGDYFVYGINFVRGIVLARILMPEMYGVFRLADFFKGIFGQPKNVGFDQALINETDDLEQAYNGHFILNIIGAGLGFILAGIAAPLLIQVYDPRVVWVLFFLMGVLLMQALYSTPATYLRKNFAFRRLSVVSVVGAFISLCVSVYLALAGYGVWALVSVVVVMEGTKLVLLWVLADWRPSFNVNWNINKKMLRFGGTLWVGGLFSFIMLQFDDYLVGQFAGLTVLGFYAKAYTLAQQPLGLFSQVVNKVAAPTISELRNKPEKLAGGFDLVVGLVFKGTIFIGMVLFIWAPEIIELLIGEKWLPMVPMFRGLIFYLIAQPIWDIVGSFLTFTGKPKLLAQGQALQAVLLLIFGTVSVIIWGGVGAAVTVSIILATTTIWYIGWYLQKEIKVDWLNMFVLPFIAVIIAGGVSWYIIENWFNEGLIFWLMIIVLPAIMYLIFISLFQAKKLKQDIVFLFGVIKRKK